jgi:hypothetical protein
MLTISSTTSEFVKFIEVYKIIRKLSNFITLGLFCNQDGYIPSIR